MTVAGQHTIAETEELIDQKQRDINAYAKKFSEERSSLMSLQFQAATDWERGFKKLQSRWVSASVKAKTLLVTFKKLSPMVPNSAVPAEPAWNIVLKALGRDGKDPSFADLVNFWAGHNWPKPEIITIQPESTDLDLEVFQGADNVTDGVENAGNAIKDGAKSAAPVVLPLIIGLAALFVGYTYITTAPIRRLSKL